MQSASMVERLGLGAEVRELKLGPSFTSNSSKFHTLKYDFKPASVDDSKEARVDVGSDNTVTVTVPHLDGAGTPHTVFKGSQRPYNKEYVLVIDKATGEVTLEKLSANIQVKKTRAEPKKSNNTSMPVEVKRSPTYGRANGRTKVISGKKREPSLQLHPKQNSPRTSPSSPVQSSSGAPTLASLPLIGSDNDDFAPSASMPGSSSAQTVAQSASISNTKSTTLESDSSSSSSSSDSSSSDYETENVSVPTAINGNLNGTTASPTLFAADNLLNDDLQLSESESDSD
ncbi:PREDICTED: ell-associated factor Eaf isoform X1 [Wasmannia auropunctata]|uniref:ell-associated factor Eaf isoform X1 n=1 Tax=Wasmannia auropunctata TaxID=64793 RepID=UPI0005EDC472|nr:PREDICTED: ell-associated factor Eaf isoform X1 [Wasmannia auropunctata]XP_011689742.1 PREDICTED: ell-associated factor Eaf isoform X1 [Wasmannia auropunctata]